MLNKCLLTLVSALLCLTLGCNEGGGAQTQLPAKGQTTSSQAALLLDDKDTYAVYDALLGVTSKDDASKSSDAITILNHTKIGVSCSDISMTIDPRRLTAGRDFSQQNSVERLLIPDSFKLSRKVNMVSSAELDRIFADGPKGWPAFHTAYPGTHGYIELSAVGFSNGQELRGRLFRCSLRPPLRRWRLRHTIQEWRSVAKRHGQALLLDLLAPAKSVFSATALQGCRCLRSVTPKATQAMRLTMSANPAM